MTAAIKRLRGMAGETSHLRELADGRTWRFNSLPSTEKEKRGTGWLVTIEGTPTGKRRLPKARITHRATMTHMTELPNRVLFHKKTMRKRWRGAPKGRALRGSFISTSTTSRT